MTTETRRWTGTSLPVRFGAVLLSLLSLAAADAPLVLRVSPKVALPPLDRVRIEVIIPRHTDNRAVCIELDGPGAYSNSCVQLDGEEAPAIIVRNVLSLTKEGEYVIAARLFRTKPEPFAVARTVVVVGGVSEGSEGR